MSDALNQHKAMAMGIKTPTATGTGSTPKYAKGGKVGYAEGGKVMPEKGVANLPAKGNTPKLSKPEPHAIATMKRGGGARGR